MGKTISEKDQIKQKKNKIINVKMPHVNKENSEKCTLGSNKKLDLE